MKKSIPLVSMFFYVLSVVFLVCACFNFVMFYQVLSELSGSAQSAGVSFNNIVATYISEVGPYVAYSSLLYGVGNIIAKLDGLLYIRPNVVVDEKGCVFKDVTVEVLPEEEIADFVLEDMNDDQEEA